MSFYLEPGGDRKTSYTKAGLLVKSSESGRLLLPGASRTALIAYAATASTFELSLALVS